MVTITKGQSVPENPELEVLSPSGDYDENDLIECTKIGEAVAFCSFEAQFIANGHTAYDEQVIPT